MNSDIQKRQLEIKKRKVSSPLEKMPDNTVGKKKKCGPKFH
jgi:hypothetical protein